MAAVVLFNSVLSIAGENLYPLRSTFAEHEGTIDIVFSTLIGNRVEEVFLIVYGM
jgi:hypothetical protein